jgi:hypothetical protein
MLAPGSESIFVCYRRSDSADTVDRIYELLEKRFSRRRLFRDVDSIQLGIEFRGRIIQALEASSIVLIVIGPGWLEARTEDGQRRIDNPLDHVRVEIETALRVEGLRVIPILVRNASMPRSGQLPDSIQGLVGRSGLSIRPNPDFPGDMDRLVRVLRQAIAEVRRRRYRWLRLAEKLSFVPFVLVLLSWLLPFHAPFHSGERMIITGFEYLSDLLTISSWVLHPFWFSLLLSAFLCPIFVLSSQCLKYRKAVLEVVVSWMCFFLLAGILICETTLDVLHHRYEPHAGIGIILACTFAAAGAIIKTWLLIHGRKLNP